MSFQRQFSVHQAQSCPISPDEDNPLTYHYQTPGTIPGTLRIAHDAYRTVLALINYDSQQAISRQDLTPEDCRLYVESPSISWIDIGGLGTEEILYQVGEMASLDPYLLEDVVNVPQRPKIEEYPSCLLILTQAAILKPKGDGFWLEQVSFVLGKNYVLTFQEEPLRDCFDLVRDRILNNKGKIRQMGADYLCYALWDAVIDSYYPALTLCRERLEILEEEIFFKPTVQTLETIYTIRKELITLNQGIQSQREALDFLLKDGQHWISKKVRTGLRDCHDHATQITATIDTALQMIEALLNLYLSALGNKNNEVMKVLTVVATIFSPLTFIAGIYGMNFNPDASPWNMPELNWYFGYPFCLGVMVAIATISVTVLWRQGLLKPQIPRLSRTKR